MANIFPSRDVYEKPKKNLPEADTDCTWEKVGIKPTASRILESEMQHFYL